MGPKRCGLSLSGARGSLGDILDERCVHVSEFSSVSDMRHPGWIGNTVRLDEKGGFVSTPAVLRDTLAMAAIASNKWRLRAPTSSMPLSSRR